MTDANAKTPTDAGILSLAYDCSALPETCTDATLLVFAHAVLAKWGAPTPASQPVAAPVGMEPVYQIGQPFPFDPENTWRDASKDAYDVHMPNRRRIIYTAAQVQAMLAAAPRNATLYNPDDVAFPVQRCADGTDAPTELTSIAKQASTAAARKGGQHAD